MVHSSHALKRCLRELNNDTIELRAVFCCLLRASSMQQILELHSALAHKAARAGDFHSVQTLCTDVLEFLLQSSVTSLKSYLQAAMVFEMVPTS